MNAFKLPELLFPKLAGYNPRMADEPENLTHAYLRRMDAKLDRLLDDMQDVKVRVTSLEENYGAVSRRLDRIERDVSHIKKRLDLVEA